MYTLILQYFLLQAVLEAKHCWYYQVSTSKKDSVFQLLIKAFVWATEVQQVSFYSEFASNWTLLQVLAVHVINMYSVLWINSS